jgi:hypothetical protein
MKTVTLKLTMEELNLLTTLVADQLFRKEFIDPKMPGYKTNADDIVLGKDLIRRLRHMLDPLSPKRGQRFEIEQLGGPIEQSPLGSLGKGARCRLTTAPRA